ncbi:hypothetical protein NDU88_006974 [Pleurodeles waltl]|uniref:Uncharacterized protein n=1 Tax=Pleurodeles waltl TaxID=8319 RepID=A0AAV7N2Z9_PLEWA|nr:hypothetical protein NDU88_006974 [Pleurodeles waltl]
MPWAEYAQRVNQRRSRAEEGGSHHSALHAQEGKIGTTSNVGCRCKCSGSHRAPRLSNPVKKARLAQTAVGASAAVSASRPPKIRLICGASKQSRRSRTTVEARAPLAATRRSKGTPGGTAGDNPEGEDGGNLEIRIPSETKDGPQRRPASQEEDVEAEERLRTKRPQKRRTSRQRARRPRDAQ